jgi:Co/Zn/Cd efflux system component
MGSLQVTLSLILLIFIVVEMSLSSSMEKGPDGYMMLYLSSASLVCNSICLYVLEKNKSKDSNISASIVFSAIDLWANIGSLIAAVLTITISKVGEYPDLIISVFIFILIAIEATKIFINRFKHKDKEINFLD